MPITTLKPESLDRYGRLTPQERLERTAALLREWLATKRAAEQSAQKEAAK